MHILLARTAFCDTASIEEILEAIGCHRADDHVLARNGDSKPDPAQVLKILPTPTLIPADTIGGIDALADWLAASDSTRLLALHAPPEAAIARAIADDQQPLEQAIEQWSESARNLLATTRHYRRRTTLFDVENAAWQPDAFSRALGEHLALEIAAGSALAPETNPEQAREKAPDTLHRIIAAQAVAQSLALQDLRDELEASAIPLTLGAERTELDCTQALEALREQDRERQHTNEENELLLLQLHQVQEELETYYLEAQDLAKEKNQPNERQNEEKKEKETLRKENRHLLKRRNELKQEVARLTRERDRARQQVKELKNSRSWKVTRPLRAISGVGKPSVGA